MKSLLACLVTTLLFHLASAEIAKAPPGFRVCIDPGHPSENNDGLALTNGLSEASVNWQVAVLLRRELEGGDIEVVMTKKSESEFVSNEDRAAIANNAHADLFLRLHADAGNSTGFTVYYPRKEGSIRGKTGPGAAVLRSSAKAATLFHRAFTAALQGKLRDNGLRGDEETFIGGRQGALTGSIFSTVPTILVEMVFLTNRTDAEWIGQEPNRIVMAKALATGVRAVRAANEKP
ncbi:MAG: N-acetylmuramoyl-L-alanine amidase [Verrucomicrobiota bacterium]|jgi:N-acetylmuramoyl-L-alanine amidase